MNIRRSLIRVICGFITCATITGCGSSNVSISTTEPSPELTRTTIGTNGQLISIQSSNVSAAGYDKATMVMTVLFNSGALYEYYGVPEDLWTSFVAAQPNPWSQVGNPRLVGGGYAYKRIG